MPAARNYLWIALTAALAGCSKSEPPAPPKAQPQASAPAAPSSAAAPAAPAKQGDIDDGLKERLARQEAAAKMFESKVLSPPAPAAPKAAPVESKPAPAPAAPQPAQGTVASTPKAEPPKAAPAKAEPPRPAPPKVEPPKAESPKTESAKAAPAASPPPRTDLAAARTAQPPATEAVTRLISRVDPEFPREAAGYEQGNVKARMTLDATGSVTRVEILAANPRRVFDRSVVRALTQWRYNEGAAGRTVDMEVDFKR